MYWPRAVPLDREAIPACKADSAACNAMMAESWVVSLPVEPLMMDCAADASAAWVAAKVAAAVAAAVLEALGIVDIEMLRTSVLLLSLNDKRL